MKMKKGLQRISTRSSSESLPAASPVRVFRRVVLLRALACVVGVAGGGSGCLNTSASPGTGPGGPAPCAQGTVRCPSGACAAAEACADATLGLSRDAQGVWIGYFENLLFASGSDALRISMSVSGDEVSADIKMGGDDVPLPSSQYKGADGGWFRDAGGTPGFEVREGFTYHTTDVRWQQLRLKMTVPLGEAWKDWCAAFPPSTYKGVTFYCPPAEWVFGNGEGNTCVISTTLFTSETVDCAILQGCSLDHCSCNVTSCRPNDAKVSLDIALRGDTADGSALLGGVDPVTLENIPVNVHLTRISH